MVLRGDPVKPVGLEARGRALLAMVETEELAAKVAPAVAELLGSQSVSSILAPRPLPR
jgi:hypothetical protein